MSYEWHDDFRQHRDREYPDGWVVERHSALTHDHAYVQDGMFGLFLPGNKQMPITPPLGDFTLVLRGRGDIHFNTVTGIVIYFRYDPAAQDGYYLFSRWGAQGLDAVLGWVEAGEFHSLESRHADAAVPDVSQSRELRLTVAGDRFEFACGETRFEPFQDPGRRCDRPGRIALEHMAAGGAAPGGSTVLGRHLLLESVRITSAEEFPVRRLWPPARTVFPPDLHGMQKPFVFETSAVEIGGCPVLSVRLTGGATQVAPEFPGGFCIANEELTRPFVRLEMADGTTLGPYYLVNGTVGLRTPRPRQSFMFFPADAECPLEADIRLPAWPDGARLFVGYEFFQQEGVLSRRGGPAEAWTDPGTGKVLYAGAPLREGCRLLEIASSDHKAVCRRLSKDDPRHEKAMDFARANHFFVEEDPVEFRAFLRFRDRSMAVGEWTLHARLEDAFREPMDAALTCSMAAADDGLSIELDRRLAVRSVCADIKPQSLLPVGVYHLVVEASNGGRTMIEKRCAFGVMPADPCALPAPLVSGLPELHQFLYEWSGFATSSFDPWLGCAVDDGHYVTGAYYQPDFARKMRVWLALHAYGRQFQLILTQVAIRDADPALYADLIKEADLVNAGGWIAPGRCDLWKRSAYVGYVLGIYRDFVREHAADGPGQRALTETSESDGPLTPGAFLLLTQRCWKPWLDYFARRLREQCMQNMQALEALKPRSHVTRFPYALYPPYASTYKGGYFPLYMGYDVTRPARESASGPVFLEDYPYASRYCIQRGVYQLTALKMVAPQQRIFVEMYSGCACPADGALLFAHPPYSAYCPPPLFFRKRLFEFAFAAVWFGKNGFAYWRDHGFHARDWDREQMETVLKTWAAIRRAPPVKPLRTTAFGFSLDVCRRHPDYYEPEKPGSLYAWGDMFNTAEECTAFAYEQARCDGQSAGFLLDLNAVAGLDAADVDTIVLPPLTGVAPDVLNAIREKHRQGVNLVGFEDVTGLEDLFGVRPRPAPAAIRAIRLHAEAAGEDPWRELAGLSETTSHPLCKTGYEPAGAMPLLDGMDAEGRPVGPAVVTHRTPWGRTALFCIPPTVVRRADLKEKVEYGQESLSRLMNRVTALVLRSLSRPVATTTAGKLIAFRDSRGRAHAVVTEDAWPETPRPIEPRVTLHLPDVRRDSIRCDRPFSIIEWRPDRVVLRVRLEPHDSAMIGVDSGEKGYPARRPPAG